MEKEILDSLSDGKIFTVVFTKRTTGERRVMRARRGVVKYLRGGEMSYDPTTKDLMTCFDLEKLAYRTFPIDAIIELRHHGRIDT